MIQMIKKDDESPLFVGDSFGLLPDAFWFNIIQSSGETNDDNQQHPTTPEQSLKRKSVDECESSAPHKKVKEEPEQEQEHAANDTIQDEQEEVTVKNVPTTDENNCESVQNGDANVIPTASNSVDAKVNGDDEKTVGISENVLEQSTNLVAEPVVSNIEHNEDNTTEINNPIENSSAPNAMADNIDAPSIAETSNTVGEVSNPVDNSSTPAVANNINAPSITETSNTACEVNNPVDNSSAPSTDRPIKTEPPDTYETSTSNNPTAGPSNVTVKTEIKTEVKEEASNQNAAPLQRQCCRYGIRCYR